MTNEEKQRFIQLAKELQAIVVSVVPDAANASLAINLGGPVEMRAAEVRVGRANGAGWESFGFPMRDTDPAPAAG